MTSIGIAITIALLVAALVWGYQMTPSAEPCSTLTYTIEDSDERLYLSERELNALLRAQDIYPVGRPIDRVSLYRIEEAIQAHPMVRTAECFATPNNEVRVKITQRIPLLRVKTQVDTYFIDTDRHMMPAREAIKDKVLTATGAVGPQIAANQLADFAEWVADERYWREKIAYLYVRSPQMIVLHLTDTIQPRVLIGPMRDYERKLNKLRVYLDNGGPATADKKYYELDIRFRGQVIGRY